MKIPPKTTRLRNKEAIVDVVVLENRTTSSELSELIKHTRGGVFNLEISLLTIELATLCGALKTPHQSRLAQCVPP